MRKALVDYLESEIEKKHIPGAVLLVSHKGNVILKEAIGYKQVFPEKKKMTTNTVFDLASLTKVVATLPAVLKLKDSGLLSLDDSVQKYIPGFSDPAVTIKHLLTHTSGLPASKHYSQTNFTYDQVIQDINSMGGNETAGTEVVYSDLGFILLKEVVEEIVKEEYLSFLKRELFDPLQMSETSFNPKLPKDRYATTEFSKEINGYKCGEVHDENAYYMGGICGHAGLFSTIDNLSNFAQMIESNGSFKGKQLFNEETIALSKKNFTKELTEMRGLGWLLNGKGYNPCGDLFAENSYGHTGFTGTSIWFDPNKSLYIIMLTNRVHFGRHRHILSIRPHVHSIIQTTLFE